jgi:HAD superfamily hydrolase (TIGR01458 family)
VAADDILSPPVAALHWLTEHTSGPVAQFVPENTRAEFSDLAPWSGDEQEPVAAVVLGDLAHEWTFARLNAAFRLLMHKPPPALVALGMTRYWRTEAGLQLDVGPFAIALHYATGVEPLVMGKPAAAFFHTATDMIGLRPDGVLMIGDDIRGDIGGAQQAGLAGALVKTGKFRPADLEGDVRPDVVLDSIADLPAWWDGRAQS